MIPICEKSYPDELLWNYMSRLCRMNGYDRLSDFCRRYFGGRAKINPLFPSGLCWIYEAGEENSCYPTMEQMIAMTPFHAYLIKYPFWNQLKHAEELIYDKRASTPEIVKKQRTLNLCPFCCEGDREQYGEAYFHVSHQLPGVKICIKHKVPLWTVQIHSYSRDKCRSYSWEEGTPFLDVCIETAYDFVTAQIQQNEIFRLMEVSCNDCGAGYYIHPAADKEELGCPYCNRELSDRDILNRRLRIRYGGEYVLSEKTRAIISKSRVIHTECGNSAKKLNEILWGNEMECRCKKSISAESLQKRLDPEKTEYIFLNTDKQERKRKITRFYHKKCESVQTAYTIHFIKRPHCPLCDSKVKVINIEDVAPDYEIISDYHNNIEKVLFRHKSCGRSFYCSKTGFLSGVRCPLCTARYDYAYIRNVMREYTDAYHIERVQRGMVSFVSSKGLFYNVNYTKVITELSLEESRYFRIRKKYEPLLSKKRNLYDSVRHEMENKGFWTFTDGYQGEKVDRITRNMIQDMARQNILARIEKGKYVIGEGVIRC